MKNKEKGYSQILLLLIATFIIIEITIIGAKYPIKFNPILPNLAKSIQNSSGQQIYSKIISQLNKQNQLNSISQVSVASIQSNSDLDNLNLDVDKTDLSALDNQLDQFDKQQLNF